MGSEMCIRDSCITKDESLRGDKIKEETYPFLATVSRGVSTKDMRFALLFTIFNCTSCTMYSVILIGHQLSFRLSHTFPYLSFCGVLGYYQFALGDSSQVKTN